MQLVNEHKEYYTNGRLKRVYFIDENKTKQGKSIEFYQNGNKMYETNFVDGKEHGSMIVYEKNETVKYHGEYKNGKRHGAWVYTNKKAFYINGKECDEEDFKLYLVKTRFDKEKE